MGRPAYQRLKGKSAGLVMPRTEWHGEIVYWGKVQPVHAWKNGLKSDDDDDDRVIIVIIISRILLNLIIIYVGSLNG